MLRTLRAHFNEKDSTTVFTDLQNAVQEATETPQQFVIKLFLLRQKVINLSREEGFPMDEKLISKSLFRSLFNGLRNSNIRSELREKWRENFEIADEELLKFVSDVVANDAERNEKLNLKKPSVNEIEIKKTENTDNSNRNKKANPILEKMEEMQSANDRKMAALETQLAELRSVLLKPDLSGKPGSGLKSSLDVNSSLYIPTHMRIVEVWEIRNGMV